MQQPAGGSRPLDRATGSGRGRQTQIGSARRKGKRVEIPCRAKNPKRWGKKNGGGAGLDEDFNTKMENGLELNRRPYDQEQPVVCLDEKPIALHADVRPASPAT